MSESHDSKSHPRHDHERSDAALKPLIYSALILAGATGAAILAMVFLFNWLEEGHRRADRPVSPLSETIERPAVPLLQAIPSHELDVQRRLVETQLNSYGWVDPDRRIVRLPIQRAMEILAGQGLKKPAWSRASDALSPDEGRGAKDDGGAQ